MQLIDHSVKMTAGESKCVSHVSFCSISNRVNFEFPTPTRKSSTGPKHGQNSNITLVNAHLSLFTCLLVI